MPNRLNDSSTWWEEFTDQQVGRDGQRENQSSMLQRGHGAVALHGHLVEAVDARPLDDAAHGLDPNVVVL
jgi:hypothetical protein